MPLIDANSAESLTTADLARIAGPAFSTALHSALQVAQQAIQNAIKSTGDPAIDINRRGKYLQSTIDTEFTIIPSNPLYTTNDKGQRQLCRWKVLHTPSAGSSLEQTFARTESCVEQVVPDPIVAGSRHTLMSLLDAHLGVTPTRGSDAVVVPTTMCVWADDRGRIAHVKIQTGQPAAGDRDLYKGMASGSTVLAPSEVSAGSDGPNEQAVACAKQGSNNEEAARCAIDDGLHAVLTAEDPDLMRMLDEMTREKPLSIEERFKNLRLSSGGEGL